jgi:hypothetical protein
LEKEVLEDVVASWRLGAIDSVTYRCQIRKVGIPVKVNGDSSGKPNGVPLKANSRRSEATLAG